MLVSPQSEIKAVINYVTVIIQLLGVGWGMWVMVVVMVVVVGGWWSQIRQAHQSVADLTYKLPALQHGYILITCFTECWFRNVAIAAYKIQVYLRELLIIIIRDLEYGRTVYIRMTQRPVFIAKCDWFILHGTRPYQRCRSWHWCQPFETLYRWVGAKKT